MEQFLSRCCLTSGSSGGGIGVAREEDNFCRVCLLFLALVSRSIDAAAREIAREREAALASARAPPDCDTSKRARARQKERLIRDENANVLLYHILISSSDSNNILSLSPFDFALDAERYKHSTAGRNWRARLAAAAGRRIIRRPVSIV